MAHENAASASRNVSEEANAKEEQLHSLRCVVQIKRPVYFLFGVRNVVVLVAGRKDAR